MDEYGAPGTANWLSANEKAPLCRPLQSPYQPYRQPLGIVLRLKQVRQRKETSQALSKAPAAYSFVRWRLKLPIVSFPSDCPSWWICWSYGHVPQGKPGVRTRVWRTESRFLDEEAPSTPGAWPRPQSGPLCCRQASGLRGSQRLPGPSPQRGRAQEKDDSEDSKDWGCPLFRERKQNGRLYVISLVHLPVQPSRFSFVTSALCRSRTLADSKCPKETARCNKVRPRGSRASTFCKVNTGIYITGYITQKRGKEFQSLIVSIEIKNSICTLKTAVHGKNKCLHTGTNWNVTLGAINKGDSYWVPFAIKLRAS